jgi:hypothetical protein
VTFDFLDDVFLLNLPLKPAERILKRLAFLYANLCQIDYTSQLPSGSYQDTGFFQASARVESTHVVQLAAARYNPLFDTNALRFP